MKYILDGHTVVPCDDAVQWSRWFEGSHARRRVARTKIGKFIVSTVFLGIDHSFGSIDEPKLFETMVFLSDSLNEVYCERCGTWDEAEEQHRVAVAWAGVCGPYAKR